MSWLPGLVVGVMFGVGVVLVFARKGKKGGVGFLGGVLARVGEEC